jgi:DNA-binding GntR family transcriptional regulator
MQSTRRGKLNVPVARTVLEDIAAGKLRHGQRVSEAAYSDRCKVSRTPVRQALQFLHKLRAVTIRSRFGARVNASAVLAKRILKSQSFKKTHSSSNGIHPAFVDVAQRLKILLASENGAPGAIVKDAVIARKLGVSRTTANRALALLARQNLLEPLPRRGWKRIVVGPREIIDLYEFRLAVEPAALESAWEHFDGEMLKDLLTRTQAAMSGKQRLSMHASVALDIELHRAILNACPNALIRRSMEEQEALRVIAVAPPWRVLGRMRQTFREHTAILRAMIKGDRKAAVKALREHLNRARDTSVERLKSDLQHANGKE